MDMKIKKKEICAIKYKCCDCVLEYTNFKDGLVEQKCLCCNKSYQHKFDENLKSQCFNIYKFSNNYSNKFSLLLQKSAYPYKYMDDWEKFNKTLLPKK